MKPILLTHIKSLVNTRTESTLLRGAALASLPCINNAYLIIGDDRILDYGKMEDLKYAASDFSEVQDCTDSMVLPAWCDSHTHLVFAGSRETEFVAKLKGASYAEIAASGGGIQNSARLLRDTSEDELYRQASARLKELARLGTGAIEIKSGYGLQSDSELKMLRVIKRLRQATNMLVKATFLGAHTIPAEYANDREGYIRLIIEEMIPAVAAEKLADFIDVFCEQGFFTPEETIKICQAGKDHGLLPKIHANQLSVSGGVQAGIAVGALSVDHLESMDEEATRLLAQSNTIGTLLPTAAFFLRMPYQPARSLIDAGCAIALASDFNPGSSPSGNMNFVVALSCIQMKLLPEEAINAATINGAYAMQVDADAGSITVGKKANLIITKRIPSLAYLPYAFGSNLVNRVMIGGEWIS